MNDSKKEELRKEVKALVHSEMKLMEVFLTKRVTLMLEYIYDLDNSGKGRKEKCE